MSQIELQLEEIQSKIQTDKEELQDIESLLEDDPSNSELLQLKNDLVEVIKQSTELLLTTQRSLIEDTTATATTTTSTETPSTTTTTTSQTQSITDNKTNNFSSKMVVGATCEAQYTVDDTWYGATITEINKDGTYTVTYSEYGNTETLSYDRIRPPTRSQKLIANQQLEVKKYLVAPDQLKTIPKALKIHPEDSEEVKKQKQKKIHNIKTQNRMKLVEEEGKKKKQVWKDFQNKPKKSIPGTFTDKKKGSIFSTTLNVNGRVGVIGSGRTMTQGQSFSNLPKKTCSLPGEI